MNITQRRLYMLSFVSTFLLTAPVLVFLAKGYSFDRIGGVFVHNGAITIKSNPKKVDLYLDGKKISNKMLNIINNYYVINGVRFGNHTIEVKKNGYTTWKKKIDVHSGVSTEFWNILLFPVQNLSLQIHAPENIRKFFLSPRQDNELVLYKETNIKIPQTDDEDRASTKIKQSGLGLDNKYVTEKTISLFTTNNRQETTIYSTTEYEKLLPDNNENVEWSSNHKKLLIPATASHNLSGDNDHFSSNLLNPEQSPTQKDYIILNVKNKEYSNVSLIDILSKIDFAKLADNKSQITTKKNIHVVDKSTLESSNLKPTEETTASTAEKTKLTDTKKVSLKNNSLIDETINTGKNFPKIYQARWMFDSDHQILMLTKDHNLFFIDVNNPSQSSLLANNVNGFDLAGDHVYYSSLTSNSIWDIKPTKPGYKHLISEIVLEENYDSFIRLFAYDELRMALITAQNNLYILNKLKPENKLPLKFVENNVLGVQFSDDGKKLLYWTDNSFWTYMLRKWDKQPKRAKDAKIFITNFTSGVHNVQWMEAYENILFTNNNLVKSAELDNRDQINLSNVLQSNSLAQEGTYLYDKETSILYFLDTTDDNSANLKLKSAKLLEKTGLFGLGR